ncbi:unnamed protein product [Diplocarpon coronariae]
MLHITSACARRRKRPESLSAELRASEDPRRSGRNPLLLGFYTRSGVPPTLFLSVEVHQGRESYIQIHVFYTPLGEP